MERVECLTLTGSGADVSVRSVAILEPLKLIQSELALDLREIREDPILDLLGSGYATVQVKTPCIVQLGSAAAVLDSQIEVNGCELRAADQRVSRKLDRLKYGGVLPKRLMVTVSEGAVLDVEGEP